jgi:hypothetical protein
MSITAVRKTKPITTVTDLTTYTSFPVLYLNKGGIDYKVRRVFRFSGSGSIYIYLPEKEKAKTCTVTTYVTLTDPNSDRDWYDGSCAYWSIPANTSETNVRDYDFGSVKTRFLYIKTTYSAGYGKSNIYYSLNGSTWTKFISDAGHVTWVGKLTFRYIRWKAYNSGSGTESVGIYTIEAFDLDDYTAKYDNEGEFYLDGYIPMIWIWLDGSRLKLYVYDIEGVKITPTEYELVI